MARTENGRPRGLLVSLLLLACLLGLGAQDIVNPLIERRADPWILLHDGSYYFCASVPEYDRIEIRRAGDIAGLGGAKPVVVWKIQKRFLVEDRNIWAPELHFIDGRWYIYYAVGTSAAPYDVRIRVIENDSADPVSGMWKDLGRIDTGADTLALDATTFENRGVRYLLWGQRLTASDSSRMDLYIARMENPWKLSGKRSMIARADRDWERMDPAKLKIEGPAVLKRNGRIFVTYSTNAVDANYCMGLLEAPDDANLLDPASWTKLPGPVFRSDPEARQFGPGHNSFTTSLDGSIDYLVYHARNYERIEGYPILDPNRNTRVQPFGWDADGRPVFGRPVPDGKFPERTFPR